MREIGRPLFRRGDLIEDRRYGETFIVAVEEKYVWYENHKGVWKTSKSRALRMFEEGTAFPPLEDNDEPRWRTPYV